MRNSSPEDLLIKHHGEHAHAAHVAHLSERLFEAVKEYAGFTPADRKILHAAALLHDVGYGVDPANHVLASVKIVKRAALHGFSAAQRDLLVAVIYLHRKNFEPILKTRELTRLPHPERAMKLASLLCIADGLDHSHVQDCEIHRITKTKNTFTVWLHSTWYSGNIHWTEGKTALWHTVFDAELQFKDVPRAKSSIRLAGLLRRDTKTLAAFRTLLYAQYRNYTDNIDGACLGEDSCYLHDLRVALRRARMLFTYFKPAFHAIEPPDAHRTFTADLISRLGRSRDFQVWMDFIHDMEPSIPAREQKRWTAFYNAENKKNNALIASVSNLLKAPTTVRKNRALAYYLRSTLPDIILHNDDDGLYACFAAKRLSKLLKKLLRLPPITENTPPAKAHEIRIAVRKLRYFSEYAEPVLPAAIRELTIRLKKVADALGSMHDMDVHLAHINRLKKTPPPATLKSLIMEKRRQYWMDYHRTWALLLAPAFQQTVQSTLKRVKTKSKAQTASPKKNT